VTDRLSRVTTALAVAAVAVVAAVISYQHAFELVRSHRESGVTARLLPFTVGRADLGGVHGGAGRQPTGPAGTTPGGVEPGRGDLGDGWGEPGPMGWGMGRWVRWSAPGPRWRWLAHSSC
jgi:hypothetical protein